MLAKEEIVDSRMVVLQLSVSFRDNSSLLNDCSGHEGVSKITQSMFGLTGMNVAKVENEVPLLEGVESASACSQLKKDQWRHAVLKYLIDVR